MSGFASKAGYPIADPAASEDDSDDEMPEDAALSPAEALGLLSSNVCITAAFAVTCYRTFAANGCLSPYLLKNSSSVLSST